MVISTVRPFSLEGPTRPRFLVADLASMQILVNRYTVTIGEGAPRSGDDVLANNSVDL
jgi:hypothetical protein